MIGAILMLWWIFEDKESKFGGVCTGCDCARGGDRRYSPSKKWAISSIGMANGRVTLVRRGKNQEQILDGEWSGLRPEIEQSSLCAGICYAVVVILLVPAAEGRLRELTPRPPCPPPPSSEIPECALRMLIWTSSSALLSFWAIIFSSD